MQYFNQIQIHRINNRHYTFPLSNRIMWKQIIQINLLLLRLLQTPQNLPLCSYNKLAIFVIQPPAKTENFDNLTCSPLIKGHLSCPLIHYIVNTDTNLINATTSENTNATSYNNLIMVIYLYYQYRQYRAPFRLIHQLLITLMRQLVQEYLVTIYRPFELDTHHRWYF